MVTISEKISRNSIQNSNNQDTSRFSVTEKTINEETKKSNANTSIIANSSSIDNKSNKNLLYKYQERFIKGKTSRAQINKNNIDQYQNYDGSYMKPATSYDYSQEVIEGKFSEDWKYIINGKDGTPIARWWNVFVRDWSKSSTSDKIDLAIAAVPFIRMGKLVIPREFFHRFIKPDILRAAFKVGDYTKTVGKNPDIIIESGMIILKGAKDGPFKGKLFSTGLDIADFIQ